MCKYVAGQPFIPAPNTARVRMQYTEFGQTLENVFHFESTGPFTVADLTALAASVVTEWNSNIKPIQSSGVTLDLVECTALDSSSGFQVTQNVGTIGGVTGVAAAPTSVTLAIKFTTGLIGRSQRGRLYFIGTNNGQLTADQYNSSNAAGILSAYVTFFGHVVATTGFLHVVVSYCNAKAWRAIAQRTPVTGYALTDINIDSQRRRLAGRGI